MILQITSKPWLRAHMKEERTKRLNGSMKTCSSLSLAVKGIYDDYTSIAFFLIRFLRKDFPNLLLTGLTLPIF